MISNDDIFSLNKNRDDLAAKIFIYESGDENNTPLLEVAFVEFGNDEYRIWPQWFSKNGPILARNIRISRKLGAQCFNHHKSFLQA